MTPQEAHEIGSDYIVVGRPIIQAENHGMLTMRLRDNGIVKKLLKAVLQDALREA